jgi:clan AA aspartic protease (TIGR02281 family)
MPRMVVVRRQIHYRVVHHARPGSALPPPKPPKKGGGGWLVGLVVVGALAVVGKLAGGASNALPAAPAGRQIRIEADAWNQCYATVWVTGPGGRSASYNSLLDSGDADTVTLNRRQAAQLGFTGLSFDQEVETANGIGKAARIEIPQFSLSGYRIADVAGHVDYNGMGAPLIGADILKALKFQVRDGSCTLTVPE